MTRVQTLAIALALFAAGLVAWRLRPAGIDSAQVTAVEPGAPPRAHVALAYGPGVLPAHVIVDLLDGDGRAVGSVTAPGGRLLLEVPLSRAGGARVRATTYHRRPWGVRVAARQY